MDLYLGLIDNGWSEEEIATRRRGIFGGNLNTLTNSSGLQNLLRRIIR